MLTEITHPMSLYVTLFIFYPFPIEYLCNVLPSEKLQRSLKIEIIFSTYNLNGLDEIFIMISLFIIRSIIWNIF